MDNVRATKGHSMSAEFESVKAQGNAAFAREEYREAIRLYTKALEIDPFNHIVYSNRSASYLKKGDLEDALKDAEQCVTLDATWAKGYGRKGAALFALGRLDDALAAYKHGLHLEPLNAMLREGLSEVQAAIDARKAAEGAEPPENSTDAPSESPAEAASLDLDAEFASFMDEISAVAESVDVLAPKVVATKKYEWEPGTTKQQIDRLLQDNYKFINLNPFEVLQLPVEATEEEIKVRYRKISALVHPDKCPEDTERAGLAFQEVKNAHLILLDPEQRASAVKIIEASIAEAHKEAKKLHKQGKKLPHSIDDEITRQTRMAFARVDHQKQNYERRMKKHAEREWEKEVDEKNKMLAEVERQKQWEQGREHRVGNWKEFGTDETRKKAGVKRRDELAYGTVKDGSDAYKKKWR